MAYISGTNGADQLTGTSSSDYINGLAGDDVIYGGLVMTTSMAAMATILFWCEDRKVRIYIAEDLVSM